MTCTQLITENATDSFAVTTNDHFEFGVDDTDFASIFGDDQASLNQLRNVAANDSVPAVVLEQLMYHPELSVRVALATNNNMPIDALKILSSDRHIDVRMALASNQLAPIEVLRSLLHDESSYVAFRALNTLDRISVAAGAIFMDRPLSVRKLLA